MITLSQLKSTISEKGEHKRSLVYKKLAPKNKKAVDDVYSQLEKTPGRVLTTFSKVMKDVALKYKVQQKDIEAYFKKETGLTI